ncbi:MAG: N-acetyltransferase, partial [Candidatus Electrothrix sp. EH2]|nr:N-acetyltransferase [Candidatus Electrothrix sp. EH2]
VRGGFASKLSLRIDNQEIICIGTYTQESLIGSIFFTCLRFKEAIRVYLLAPVAVSTKQQRKGVGQALIGYGLHELKKRSATVVITYGDPLFYSKVGFQALSEKVIKAPRQLSRPEGWLALSLTEEPIPTLNDRPVCVKEFDNPLYW